MTCWSRPVRFNQTIHVKQRRQRRNVTSSVPYFISVGQKDAGPLYRQSGNILLSSLMGADLYLDETERPIEDQSPLLGFVEQLKIAGHKPYLIPGGASEHRLGGLGYMACAAELVIQSRDKGIQFDYVVHCTGSSSTQAGLVAGFTFLNEDIKVIGIADDDETDIKRGRVLELANCTLDDLELSARVSPTDIEIISVDQSDYGTAEPETLDVIRLLARSEGLVADPVYEGKALRGLQQLATDGRFESDSRVLLMHLGGTPAVHAYANQFGETRLFANLAHFDGRPLWVSSGHS